MIVVIGPVGARRTESGEFEPSGFAAHVAVSAAAAGATVELVSRLGDDPTGDAVLIVLAQAGVGHVATLREGGARTPVEATAVSVDIDEPLSERDGGAQGSELDAADIGLALRYLSDYRVIVLAHPGGLDVVEEALAAAGWGPAHLVVVTAPGTEALPVSPGALVLSADRNAEATAARLGRYAAAIDSGDPLASAYAVLTGATADS